MAGPTTSQHQDSQNCGGLLYLPMTGMQPRMLSDRQTTLCTLCCLHSTPNSKKIKSHREVESLVASGLRKTGGAFEAMMN
jgi:hypothetical protein